MNTSFMKRLYCMSLSLTLLVLASGCLKTRAQLKEDDASPPTEVSNRENVSGGYALDEIKGEITRMTGRIEDLERAKLQSGNTAASTEDLKKLETRIIELEQSQLNMIDAFRKLQDEKNNNPENLFNEGKKQFEADDFESASKNLEQYLKTTNSKANLEEANFLLAESYFKLNQFKKAIVPYAKIQEKFNRSKRIPTVLLRIASCFEALGMKSDARAFWEQLADQHPKTAEGKEAKKHLGNKKLR